MTATYMDRADAATGYRLPPPPPGRVHEDPRYWNGSLYATVTDRMAAEARAIVRWTAAEAAHIHKWEIRHGIKLGTRLSTYQANGQRKCKCKD